MKKLLLVLAVVGITLGSSPFAHAQKTVFDGCGSTVGGDYCCWTIDQYDNVGESSSTCYITYSDCNGAGSSSETNCVKD